jgi:periodic tryptophan protein 2
LKGTIEARNDICGGRLESDRMTSKNSTKNKHFTSLSIRSAGGAQGGIPHAVVIAGGNSKYLCLYDIAHKILLRRFEITQNRSLDGVLDKLNSKKMNEFGNHEDDVEGGDSDENEDENWKGLGGNDEDLPGAKKKPKIGQRKGTKLALKVRKVCFAPDGKSFAVATTEGLLIYSLEGGAFGRDNAFFTPFELDVTVTLENLIQELKNSNYTKALIVSSHSFNFRWH